ncbi:MAG: hypothetical protein U9N47_06995 [Thermodesulfobacteriota bacterium]|nr:hypothetical protein [Thermodesulfobacteriota bacterium]
MHNFGETLVKDKGDEKIIVQAGRTGIFLFKKTSHIKLKVKEEYFKHIYFEQITGDFKIYKGEWILEYCQEAQGTFLTFKAEVKPDFFCSSIYYSSYPKERSSYNFESN